MLTTLTIVIGLIFVLLMFSLLASTVMEVISSVLSLRARNLRFTLDNMLGEKADDFMRHPLFRQLAYASNRRNRPASTYLPSYVSKETFLSVFMDIMGDRDRDAIAQNIAEMDEGDLKRMMQFLLRQSEGIPSRFKQRAGVWFDEVMNRASELYTRRIKYLLFAVGLVLAVLLNVDTIQIYQSIAASATIQQQMLDMASQITEGRDTLGGIEKELALEESLNRLNNAWEQFDYNTSPLGIGWGSIREDLGLPGWLLKLFGMLLSAIAVTLGAPFWFDLLKRLLSIRAGAATADKQSASEEEKVKVEFRSEEEKGGNTDTAHVENQSNLSRPVG